MTMATLTNHNYVATQNKSHCQRRTILILKHTIRSSYYYKELVYNSTSIKAGALKESANLLRKRELQSTFNNFSEFGKICNYCNVLIIYHWLEGHSFSLTIINALVTKVAV